jgi:hypothetical protein
MKWYYKNNKATLYPKPSDFNEYLRKQLYDTTYSSYVPNTWKYPDEHQKPRSYDQVIYFIYNKTIVCYFFSKLIFNFRQQLQLQHI